MSTAAHSYEELERRFVDWAQAQPALRATVVVGSRARPAPAHPLSDLDLVVFTTMPEAYAGSSAWLRALGPLWLAVRNETGGGDPEWLALYAGGFKADFVLVRTAESGSLSDRLRASPYSNVYRRGVRALFNLGGALDLPADLVGGLPTQPDLPSMAEFAASVTGAWYASDRAARLLARGDLWRARQEVDGTLKQALLQMLAWHAGALPADSPKTWDDGRFLGDWAEAAAVSALPDTFGAYATADQWRALFATLALYRRLARETASRLGYSYPADIEAQMMPWLEQLRAAS